MNQSQASNATHSFTSARGNSPPNTNTTNNRACTICSRAKTKCLWDPSSPKCQRCTRLDKDCKLVTAPRKPRYGARTKHELLERKLDRLENLLRDAQQAGNGAGNEAAAAVAARSFPSPESLDTESSPTAASESQAMIQPPADGLNDLSLDGALRMCENHQQHCQLQIRGGSMRDDHHHQHHQHHRAFVEGGGKMPVLSTSTVTGTRSSIKHSSIPTSSPLPLEPSLQEAEDCLARFRDEMLPKFPMFILKQTMRASELREESPFLWLSIMSISGRDTRKQRAMGTEVRIALAREVLVEAKSSMDLLLGVLVNIAWGQFHAFEKPISVTLIQMAQALLGNLYLIRPKVQEHVAGGPQMLNYTPRGCPRTYDDDGRTMAERRVLLGFFLLSAKTASYFQRTEPVVWTPYMEECSRVLETKAECEGDLLLVYLLKFQLVSEKAAQAVAMENSNVTDGLARVPPAYHYKNLETELQQIKRDIPASLESNLTLHLQSNQITLSIHEIAISTLAPFPTSSPHLCISRLDFLHTCFHTIKDSLDRFFAMPDADITLYPFSTIMQFGHCIITLFRLSTFESADMERDGGWNTAYVRETYDLSTVLERMAAKLGNARGAAGYDIHAHAHDADGGGDDAAGGGSGGNNNSDNTMFNLVAHMFRGFKAWWDHKVESEKAEARAAAAARRGVIGGDELESSVHVNGEAQQQQQIQPSMDLEMNDFWFGDFMAGGGGDFGFDPFAQMPTF